MLFFLSLQFSCGSPFAHWLPICSFFSKIVPDRGCGGGRGGRVKTLQTCIIEQVRSQRFGKENKVLVLLKKEKETDVSFIGKGPLFFLFPSKPTVCYSISAAFHLSSPFLIWACAYLQNLSEKQSQLGRVCSWNYMKSPYIVPWLLLNAQWACQRTLVLRRELVYLPLNVKAIYHRRAFE